MASSRVWALVIGALFWAGAIGSAVLAGRESAAPKEGTSTAPRGASASIPGQLWQYFGNRPKTLELVFPEVPVRDGDPIFLQTAEGEWIQAGYVTAIDDRRSATAGIALWYQSDLDPAAYRLEYHRNRGKFSDVIHMLLPAEKRKQIEDLIRTAIEENGREISDSLRPVLTRAMRESVPAVENGLKASLARHRDELDRLGDRYRETIVRERLLPLVREEVLPIVRQHGEPVAKEIGREIWDRASLWRFGWRALYDRAPLPERELLSREWERFVAEEVVPIVEKHMDELIDAQRKILVDVSRNPRVRSELGAVVSEIANDEELQSLLSAMLRESIVENRELREVWAETWKSAEAQAALRVAGERLEPVVRQIGDELFGTRDGGISPSFARVLRNQVLGKDRRWIVAVPNPAGSREPGPVEVRVAESRTLYPLILLASPDQSL